MKEIERAKQMKQWLVMMALDHHMKRSFQIFDRERFIVANRKKMMPIFFMIKMRMRKRVRLYGDTVEKRQQRHFRLATQSMMGGCIRPAIRERAKRLMLKFLTENLEKAYMLSKFQKFFQRIILFQRIISLRYTVKAAKKSTWDKNQVKIVTSGEGLRMFVQAVFASNVHR